mmetsp:Transcript_27758/g.73639  ORF Transcript_27758/g.73639 Transcript_27758/m.73639 type:complete len:639 (-) Transcript_27758:131-2047(-)
MSLKRDRDESDNEYRRQLTALQRIRSIAGGTRLDLPQICVVGDQSSGKSSLLAETTGINFPVNSGICTRAPIVVECKSDVNLDAEVYEIEMEGGYKKVPRSADLAKEIEVLQDAALASMQTEGGSKVSKKEIRIRVRGPKQIDIIVVDLPGIIHNGPGKDETRELIDTYVKKEQTLILLVSEAKQDDEGCAAIGMAQQWDREGHRTLRIFTKCDTWDSEESRKRMVQRMRSESDGLVDTLRPHAVICRIQGKSQHDAEEEAKVLADMNLPGERSGMAALRDRLPPIFAELIRTNLPTLEKNIEQALQKAQDNLRHLGENEKTGDAMLLECQSILQDTLVSGMRQPISKHFSAFKEEIRGTSNRVTKEWTDSKFTEDVFECPFFQGADALLACMQDVTTWWRPIMGTYVDEIYSIARRHVKESLVEKACGIPVSLCNAVALEWERERHTLISRLTEIFDNRLRKEIPWGTANHYLTSKFKGEEALPDDMVEDFLASVRKDIGINAQAFDAQTLNLGFDSTVETYLRSKLASAKERWSSQFAESTVHEQQQHRLFCAVKAVWEVEHKTFIDYILKETNEHLIAPRNRWISTTLCSNAEIKAAAVEDPATKKKRQDFKDTVHRMEQCMCELRSMQSPGISS